MKRMIDLFVFLSAYPALYLLSLLPPAWAVHLGKWAGVLAFLFDGKHRRIALKNLRVAFPHLRASERWMIARASFENVGKTFLEIPGFARQTPEQIQRRVRYMGVEQLDRLEAEGRGALLLTGHFGNWELMALAYGFRGGRLAFVARPLDNPYFDSWMKQLRSRSGNRIISKRGALRAVYGALRDGCGVGMLMDQKVTGRAGVFVEFFNHLAGSSGAMAALACRYGAPVVPAYTVRNPSGIGHTIVVEPEVPVVRSGRKDVDIRINTQRFQKILERIVCKHPDQWFWMHRRWNRSPTVTYASKKKRKK
jgi:KDO2-lipid IV(A) lauroyltransferase